MLIHGDVYILLHNWCFAYSSAHATHHHYYYLYIYAQSPTSFLVHYKRTLWLKQMMDKGNNASRNSHRLVFYTRAIGTSRQLLA